MPVTAPATVEKARGRLLVINGIDRLMAAARPRDGIARTLAAWLRRLEEGSPRTAQAYKREASRFLAFLGNSYGPGLDVLLQAQPSDCTAYIHAIPGQSGASHAVKAAVLRGLFAELVVNGLRPDNPAREIRIRRTSDAKHHPAIPQSAIITVLDRLKGSDVTRDIRDRALLLLALAVGARRFELAALNVGSVQREADGTASVSFRGKGRKAAAMRIKSGVVAAVDRWLAVGEHGGDPVAPLFRNLSHRPEHAGKRLSGNGIRIIIKAHFPRYSPHGLRARAITDVWSQSGGGLGHAQAFARHVSPAVTERVYIQAKKLERSLEYVYDYA
jgi:site-specific recombinase XerC